MFIERFNNEEFDKGDILNLKNDLDQLYELVDLKYPACYNDQYSIKSMDISENISNLIDFIHENIPVFFHAVKLFNTYNSSFFPKINMSTNILSEMTFHNIVSLNKEFTVCLYGSIDILFYSLVDDILNYIYISDIKSGKRLYDHYFDQLYFYLWNIRNYNSKLNEYIINNTDNIDIINMLKDKITKENSKLLLFSLQENLHVNKNFTDIEKEYNDYINKIFNILKNDIYFLHKDKDFIVLEEIFNKYKIEYKLKNKSECQKKEVSYLCNYCDYAEKCEYRKLN